MFLLNDLILDIVRTRLICGEFHNINLSDILCQTKMNSKVTFTKLLDPI